MSRSRRRAEVAGNVRLRPVEEADLPLFHAHQDDPAANELAAFAARERQPFMRHWQTILANEAVTKRTILLDDEVAGNVVCFERDGLVQVGYWLGRGFWGKGIASCAVAEFLRLVPTRPLHAFVAKHNTGSVRVLEKCGFQLRRVEQSTGPAGEPVDELLYVLR